MEEKQIRKLSIRRRQLQVGYLATIVLYIVAILLFLVNIQWAFLLIGLTSIFYFGGVRALNQLYNSEFAEANTLQGAGKSLTDKIFQRKGDMTREHLRECHLFPVSNTGNKVLCRLQMKGRRDGVSVELCELTTYYDLPAGSKNKVAFLNGSWVELGFERNTGIHLLLIPKDLLDSRVQETFYTNAGYHPIPLATDKLEEQFILYGKSEKDDKLGGHFLKRCAKLIEKTESRVAIQLEEDRLCTFLDRRYISFSTPIREPITKEIVGWDRFPELHLLLELVDWCKQRDG